LQEKVAAARVLSRMVAQVATRLKQWISFCVREDWGEAQEAWCREAWLRNVCTSDALSLFG